jgi:HPt (histidine-containing phosphotransfer) domain-containing protein
MAKAFFKRCDDLIIQLGIAIQANDSEECFRIAHTIKGASRGIFAIPFSTKALKLEMAGRSQVLTDAPTLYKDLRTSYDELVTWYQKGEV